MTEPSASKPSFLIVEAADVMQEFQENVGSEMHPKDVERIVFNVVQSLLLSDREYQGQLEPVVDFNGMRSSAFYKDADMRAKVNRAAHILGAKLHARLSQLGVYEEGDFPYFFYSFVPLGDIQLHRLPH